MNEEQLENLTNIFYLEAPYDYVLQITDKKSKHLLGVCLYQEKLCVIFGPNSYIDALITALHELAHARIQHQTHSDTWEKEFVRLLTKYKVSPLNVKLHSHIMGPNVKEYISNGR